MASSSFIFLSFFVCVCVCVCYQKQTFHFNKIHKYKRRMKNLPPSILLPSKSDQKKETEPMISQKAKQTAQVKVTTKSIQKLLKLRKGRETPRKKPMASFRLNHYIFSQIPNNIQKQYIHNHWYISLHMHLLQTAVSSFPRNQPNIKREIDGTSFANLFSMKKQ